MERLALLVLAALAACAPRHHRTTDELWRDCRLGGGSAAECRAELGCPPEQPLAECRRSLRRRIRPVSTP